MFKVITHYYDNGRVSGSIEETETKETDFQSLANYDRYIDTFDTRAEAEQHLRETKNA